MKFFSQLFLTVLGGLLIALATPYLLSVFNPDRLSAEIRPGAWYPYPLGKGPYAEAFKKKFDHPSYPASLLDGEDLLFARVDIRNPGRKTVSSIRMTFGDSFDATAIVVDSQGERRVDAGKELRLADMAPGDKQTIFLWSTYDIESQFQFDDIKSNSSEGPLSIKYYKFTNDYFRVGESFPWLGVTVFFLAALTAIYLLVCVVMANIYVKYVEGLLNDEDIYINERVRYVADPKKFLIKPLS